MVHKHNTTHCCFTALTVLIALCTLSFMICATTAAEDAPVITFIDKITNFTAITFQNSTHIIISKNVSYFALKCEASYPVMWSLNSLEQPWVVGTTSERVTTNFSDNSTYKYSMTVKLNNVATVNNLPEEFACHAADLSNDLVTRLMVIWESRLSPYLNTIRNEYVNGSYRVNWSESTVMKNGISTKVPTSIFIPCYSLNVMETRVELYRKEFNQTLTFINHENNRLALRFEPYVGFFLNSTVIKSDVEVYECHAKRAEPTVVARTTTSPTPTSTKVPFTHLLKKLNISDDFDWLDELDYLYVEDLEDTSSENSTTNTLTLHTTPGTKVEGSLSAVVFTLVKTTPPTTNTQNEENKRPVIADVLSSYLNRSNNYLVVTASESNSYHVTCCIKTGTFASYSSDNILLHFKKCTEPLMCLTKNHVLKKTYIPYYSRDDSYYSSRCRSMSKSIIDDFNPNVYICHMRTDQKYSRSSYGGYFEPNEDQYDTSYLVQEGNTSTYIQFEFQSVNDNNKKRQWSAVVPNTIFYIGDIVQFRCKASPFLYARGIVWEQDWQNGTRQIIYSNQTAELFGSNIAEHSVELINNELKKISCHIPPWNSTGWITQSLPLIVRSSGKPVSPTGDTYVYENVTFYTKQSTVLKCDFEGHPPPKFHWNTTSSMHVYSAENGGSKTYPYEAYPNTTVSVSYTWGYIMNSSIDIPSQEFSCSASNVAGNATKIFNVTAIRSFTPVIAYSSRQIVVLFLNDENSLLNCSIKIGVPLPEFTWKKHGMNISTFDNYEMKTIDKESSLLFKRVNYEDEGEYTCFATNFVGVAMKEYSVRVRERPHSRHWYEFTVAILAIALIAMFGFLAYVYVTKSKKISRLEMRAEYTKSLDKHESRITVATLVDD